MIVGPYEDDQVAQEDKVLSFQRKVELLFHTKTRHCKHKSPDCVTNAVQGLISNFKIGMKIRVGITLLQLLMKGVKLNEIRIVD